MRHVVIEAYTRPHELDRGGACWCGPEECESGGHWHHRDVDLLPSPSLKMGSFAEQRERDR